MAARIVGRPIFGKHCPLCRHKAVVVRTPKRWLPAKWVLLDHFSYRSCPKCEWRGGTFHAQRSGSLRGSQRRRAAIKSAQAVFQLCLALAIILVPLAFVLFARL